MECSEAGIFLALRRDKIISFCSSGVVFMTVFDMVDIRGKIFRPMAIRDFMKK